MKKKTKNRILRFLKLLYLKLIRINDSPQKIAAGFGVGVFLGILPAAGPVAALFIAFIFRLNRLSALLGSIITNTWLTVLTFFLSIKVGSAIMNLNWNEVSRNWVNFLKEFHFQGLFKLSILKMILPVILGYFIIAFCSAITVYFITIIILSRLKRRKKQEKRSHP